MPCFKPLNAYRRRGPGRASKIVFLKSGSSIPTNTEYLRLPCGQCSGCRLDRSRSWATRCMHEARMHNHNSFITLTYDDKNLPPDGGLRLSHWQTFMKRLRYHANEFGIKKLKFMHSGEYGSKENTQRPHYHALIFGIDFPDKEFWKDNNGVALYTSTALDHIWGKGYTSVGDVTWNSAAYVARYSMKKINGALAQKLDPITGLLPYERTNIYTGDICEVIPEYSTQSRNPGLGNQFYDQYAGDIYPSDECIVNGHPTRPPRYYDNKFELSNPDEMEDIRRRRIEVMERFAADNTRARLADREKVKEAQINQLHREL